MSITSFSKNVSAMQNLGSLAHMLPAIGKLQYYSATETIWKIVSHIKGKVVNGVLLNHPRG